jgi:hypothetical protein
MKCRLHLFPALLASFLPAGGCTTSTDVTHDTRYQGGYVLGQTYVLKSTSRLFRGASDVCVLDKDDETKRYEASGMSIEQTFPAGAHIRVQKLAHVIERAPIQGESYVDVIVVPLDLACGCKTVKLGPGMSRWKLFTGPDGWPTMVGSPDLDQLALEDGRSGSEITR